MLIGGGKGLGVYEISSEGKHAQKAKIEIAVFSGEGATALLVDGDVLYVAGGNGFASFDAKHLA